MVRGPSQVALTRASRRARVSVWCARLQPLAGGFVLVTAMVVASARLAEAKPPVPVAAEAGAVAAAPASPVTPTASQLIEPADLAHLLSDASGHRPVVLHIGPAVLFRAGHVSGSRHIGAASTPEGLQALKQALRDNPPGRPIVLYCGCCPWADCPNVRPALQLAQQLGRDDVKLLHLPRNFQHDWIERKLPTSKGDQ